MHMYGCVGHLVLELLEFELELVYAYQYASLRSSFKRAFTASLDILSGHTSMKVFFSLVKWFFLYDITIQ